MTRIENPFAMRAVAAPMRPVPMTASVFPLSSMPPCGAHSPRVMVECIVTRWRAAAAMNMMASSATD